VAEQLGVAESDVVFVEPDLVHTIYPDSNGSTGEGQFAVQPDCGERPQSEKGGKVKGPGQPLPWHLGRLFSELEAARGEVEFEDPRTRVAHLDTGYDRGHASMPKHVLTHLERNFVEGDADSGSAQDPDNRLLLLDHSGHGTSTLSVLAGGSVAAWGHRFMGAAPEAEVLPLRIADSVVLFRTSAFARALAYAVDQRCDVVTMSMGGLPMETWRQTVDLAYEAGVVVVSAAGNCYRKGVGKLRVTLPTRHVVYPARYRRVIAVCGAMADGTSYSDLKGGEMEGNFGPDSVMDTAMAAYTPNVAKAIFRCSDAVALDGAGTSSATPQVAAAAALWIEKYKGMLPRNWERVEAVRNALFTTTKNTTNKKKLGRGILQARKALDVAPVRNLPKTESDKDWLSVLRVLTGLGVVEPTTRERMFNLEFMQLWLVNADLQELLPDPGTIDRPSPQTLDKVMDVVIADPTASRALRTHLVARYPVVTGRSVPSSSLTKDVVPTESAACAEPPALTPPPYRRLRIYSADPSLSGSLATVATNEVTVEVPWEDLQPGPSGEYLLVDDVDATHQRNDPVNLNDPLLLARDGWAPSAGNAQFHQQMVYAVAMKTIHHFERALGRPVLWRPRPVPDKPDDDSKFVPQLTIRPHALRQSNAYYSPSEVALKFGYFEDTSDSPGVRAPGSRVYTCLSHDIVAHETAHALLDGMYRRFNEPTNPDVLALHEAFADIVALMQHFTIREVLEAEIGRTRGDLEAESGLGKLAVEFGYSIGRQGALRDAIGRIEEGRWKRDLPDPDELRRRVSPHGRGAILVAAVFDAFIAIYKARTVDLLRIYTGGTGVLPSGAIHPDLVARLANEAATSAEHVLTMCIRALDYLPPVDLTFFEYLRALITADYDLVHDDRYDYRVAFVEAFRRRGIHTDEGLGMTPDSYGTLSVETLRWRGVAPPVSKTRRAAMDRMYAKIVESLKAYADACTYFTSREQLFEETRKHRQVVSRLVKKAVKELPSLGEELGVDPKHDFEIHEMRRAMRAAPDGRIVPQVILALTQSQVVKGDESGGVPGYIFRGGSTLVVDLAVPEVKYRIVKRIKSKERRGRTQAYLRELATDPFRAMLFGPNVREPFAALHAFEDAR
jgi:subtilisin family serine protease